VVDLPGGTGVRRWFENIFTRFGQHTNVTERRTYIARRHSIARM